MVEELPQFKPRRQEMKIRYPLWIAKSILKQSLQALAFLHGHGIAHGDFQPGNILFTLNNIDLTPEDVLRQKEDVQARSISPTVQRLDGKQDKWAPRYLCVAQPLMLSSCCTEGFKVKLSDMGGGQCLLLYLFLYLMNIYSYLPTLNSILFYRPPEKAR